MRHIAVGVLVLLTAPLVIGAQDRPPQFGGDFSSLDSRRQQLVENWVTRFAGVTGQAIAPAAFYDEVLSVSIKTTFEAVTHALMTTALTDGDGTSLGDALALVTEVDAVRGQVSGASGDKQFRIYVRLAEGAVEHLHQSQQFRRGVDNSVYHKGYPINYRAVGGVPSIQVSVSLDKRYADIDVDYRSARFPVALVNGHLTSSNSDVRAGNNYDRHVNRWSGFQNWWRSFFGVPQQRPPESRSSMQAAVPKAPRAGKTGIEVAVHDFLHAWLVEGDMPAAMGYVAEQSYACLARELDDPSTFDRGIAPFQLVSNLQAAYDALPRHDALEGLVVGTRLTMPALRVVQQPHHAQFVLYAVPDDVAATFDCQSQLSLGDRRQVRRAYGNYFGATFYVNGRRHTPVALLWGKDGGYWKIVSWKADVDGDAKPLPEPRVAEAEVTRERAATDFTAAARGFLESWLLRHDYGAAFSVVSPDAYACYNIERGDDEPMATSAEDAGRRLRAALESVGGLTGRPRRLDALIEAAEPFHPAIRVLDHRDSRTFSLSSLPTALGDAAECAARAAGRGVPDPLPLDYGKAFGTSLRFKTRAGDAPVLRLLWREENNAWRITSYGIELP